MQNLNYEPQIGDWIMPSDPIVNGINYGYNKRLIIGISEDKEEFTTVCDSFDIEERLWNIYNTEFVARVVLE
jgi:hypothetical protein